MRIVGNDGKEELAKINQPAGLAMEGEDGPVQNDMTVDAYDIVFEMGPSYNSQREEAREGMLAFLQASPELAPAMLDLVAKMQDWPLADEVAERLELLLPPQIRAAIAEKNGEPPAPPPPPPPPSPEVIAQQQQQQLDAAKIQAEMRKLEVQTQLDLKKLEAESAKIEAEMQRSQIDAEASTTKARVDVFKAQVDHHKAQLDHHKALREEQSLAASPEDNERLAGLEQGVAGIAQATAEALMPAFQALLQQQQVTAQAVAQLTQIALAPTEITHHPDRAPDGWPRCRRPQGAPAPPRRDHGRPGPLHRRVRARRRRSLARGVRQPRHDGRQELAPRQVPRPRLRALRDPHGPQELGRRARRRHDGVARLWTEPAIVANRLVPSFSAASAGSKATSSAVSFSINSGTNTVVAGVFIVMRARTPSRTRPARSTARATSPRPRRCRAATR
jgi:hypothetical protein